MKTLTLLLTAGLLAVLPVAAQAAIKRQVEKTFAVTPGGTLQVDTQGGNIRVETAEGNTVKVVAHQTIRADSESEADELLRKLELTIEENGDGVLARSKYEKMSWGRNPVQVSFVVSVPTDYNVSARTSGGDVTIADLGGTVTARTSGGNIELGKIGGPVDARTSGGNVRLAESGGAVNLQTSGGNIRLGRSKGKATLDTSGGDIEVGSVAGALQADTSGGNVTATIDGVLTEDCELSTSGGRVSATVSKDAAFFLEASTSGGSVRADGLTITISGGAVGKSKLSGKVNGGGPRLRLHSSGGDIVVKTR